MRLLAMWTVLVLVMFSVVPSSYAGHGLAQGTASLILPTTGQAMNGQGGNFKTKVMAGMEAGLITGTAILGGVVGGPVVWATVGPLIANHAWSAIDAYANATPEMTAQMSQLEEAQRILRESQERNRSRRSQSLMDVPDVY